MIGGWGFCSGFGWLQTDVGVEALAVEIELLAPRVQARRTKSSHSVAYL